jgi:hypothetical protein
MLDQDDLRSEPRPIVRAQDLEIVAFAVDVQEVDVRRGGKMHLEHLGHDNARRWVVVDADGKVHLEFQAPEETPDQEASVAS